MITTFRVQNYKSLRDVSLTLTPVHVLIGPNNSGKTSILESIQALCRSVDVPLDQAFAGRWKGRELVWNAASEENITLETTIRDGSGTFDYSLSCGFLGVGVDRTATGTAESYCADNTVDLTMSNNSFSGVYYVTHHAGNGAQIEVARRIRRELSGIHYYRWDARLLALPTAPDSSRRFRMDPTGFGLALCLDDILGYDRVAFAEMERRFCEIFPEIKSIKLVPEPAFRAPQDHTKSTPLLQMSDGKGIYFQMENSAALVPASQASDGVLLVLAYLTVSSLPEPPRVVLFEEPENGIHPKRLQDVVSMLRGLVKNGQNTQVILTTHSPYLLDLFTPEEVTICQRENGETKTARLSESKSVRDQLDIFSLGEIWTADGDEKIAQPATAGQAT